jgi:adenine deaminase
MGVGDAGSLADTLAGLLARGVPLERAVAPFTANVAALLRLPGKGVVAADADADLVVLDDAGRPRDVMARGAWHVRDGRLVRRGTFEWTDDVSVGNGAAASGVAPTPRSRFDPAVGAAQPLAAEADAELARNLP